MGSTGRGRPSPGRAPPPVLAVLERAGYHVEHSTRYQALRAAASGTYGFDACIVPVGAEERAVVDAAVSLLGDRRLALVVEDYRGRELGVFFFTTSMATLLASLITGEL